MPNTHSISVALCTYNAGEYLIPQIQSIFTQSMPPAELVVCDDGSADDTLLTLEKFRSSAPFPIHIHPQLDRLGPAKNFESCFRKCIGDILIPCDQDDIWHPDKLKHLSAALSTPNTLLAFSDLTIMESRQPPSTPSRTQWGLLGFSPAQQALFPTGHALDILLKHNVVTGAATAFHRALLTHALPIPPDYLHDEWLALIAASIGNLAPVPQPLVHYRRHAAQQVGPATSGILAQARYAREKMQTPYFQAMVRRADALCDHLATLHSLVHPAALRQTQQKQAHAHARLAMRQARLTCWPLAFHELIRNRYTKFGYGFKSFVQDLFL